MKIIWICFRGDNWLKHQKLARRDLKEKARKIFSWMISGNGLLSTTRSQKSISCKRTRKLVCIFVLVSLFFRNHILKKAEDKELSRHRLLYMPDILMTCFEANQGILASSIIFDFIIN
jgi:hypothetical protein